MVALLRGIVMKKLNFLISPMRLLLLFLLSTILPDPTQKGPGVSFVAGARGEMSGGIPAPIASQATTNGMKVSFSEFISVGGGEVLAYELSVRSLFSNQWKVIKNQIGVEGQNARVSQIITVRVDKGKSISSGTFRLGLDRSGHNVRDAEQGLGNDFVTRTPLIPWNADDATMKTMLQSLSGVEIIDVKRCDTFDAAFDNTIGYGGFEGWYSGCPYNLEGGFQWLVVFNVSKVGAFMPLLTVYRNDLPTGTWTGPANQIMITHLKQGMVSPSLCFRQTCSYSVTGLDEGTPYSFRVRALTDASGWTGYSKTSEFVSTIENRAPPRPLPPLPSSASVSSLALSIIAPSASSGVTHIQSQYRVFSSSPIFNPQTMSNQHWLVGPSLNLSTTVQRKVLILEVQNLKAATAYEFRIMQVNRVGSSPYSTTSAAFSTLPDVDHATIPPTPYIASIGGALSSQDASLLTNQQLSSSSSVPSISSHWVDVVVPSMPNLNSPVGKVSYRVQYKQDGAPHWQSVPDLVVFEPRREGVEIQEVTTRTDDFGSTAQCKGYFWLRLGTLETDRLHETVSSPISFDATSDEMKRAIYSIKTVERANPRIMVRRRTNIYNGYTWNIEIQGMGDITKLQLYKHTFFGVSIKDVDSSNVTFSNSTVTYVSKTFIPAGSPVAPCWGAAPSVPVVTKTQQNGGDNFFESSEVVRILGLSPERTYVIRTQVVDANGNPGPVSNTTSVTTRSAVVVNTFVDPNYAANALTPNQIGNPRADMLDKIGSPVTIAGIGMAPAKQFDFHYPTAIGAGMGGLSEQSGGDGYCIAILYNPRLQVSFSTQSFYYNSGEQFLTIPQNTPMTGTTVLVTFKCWGGGGGGGFLSQFNVDKGTPRSMLPQFSAGGGGAFAQITFHVLPNDVISVKVGGGGKGANGEKGGQGGSWGGGSGGDGLLGGGGGGGGGASIVSRGSDILLVAAGGAGGGSTDYCCADGGAGGTLIGYPGNYSGSGGPWPITSPSQPTSILRRYEYTASACPDSTQGQWCISVWDTLPASLPAEHQFIVYGLNKAENYSIWATAGIGGGPDRGGDPGTSGSYAVRVTGPSVADLTDGRVAIFTQGKGWEGRAKMGEYLQGGNGGEGKQGGGGGGGGFWGGGGGGSGVEAGGGGGGCSFVNVTAALDTISEAMSALMPAPQQIFINSTFVSFQFELDWRNSLWGIATKYEVEYSFGPKSQEYFFLAVVDVALPSGSNNNSIVSIYTQGGLDPDTTYSFRVIPIYSKGRGRASAPLTIHTLKPSPTYWERITSRRLSMGATGRGFSYPVLQRPHLDTGVEIFASRTSDNPMRYADGPSNEAPPPIPSARRGHTLTAVDSYVFMFGGRSNGYSCANVYIGQLNLGTPESGIDVYPCSYAQGETTELWRLDIHNYQWMFINTTKYNSKPPPAREQHVSVLVGDNIYVFGGKTRVFPVNNNTGQVLFVKHTDVVYGDLWKLSIQHSIPLRFAWPSLLTSTQSPLGSLPIVAKRPTFVAIKGNISTNSPLIGTEGTSTLLGVNATDNARLGVCIDSIVIKVSLSHPCINQIRMSIMGPGPKTGSANFHESSSSHEVTLFNQRKTSGTGCAGGTHNFVFDEINGQLYTDENGVSYNGVYDGVYKPEGPISEFVGASPHAEWTLVVQDMKDDTLTGTLLSWELNFMVSPCTPTFTWTQMDTKMPNNVVRPVSRYQPKAMAYGNSFFLWGGRSAQDAALLDLFRYDALTNLWVQLTPVNFNVALYSASSVGSNFMLTSWGILRYGGYFRLQSQPETWDNYVSDVYCLDPVSLTWQKVPISLDPPLSPLFQLDPATHPNITMPPRSVFPQTVPNGRYMAGAVFLPTNKFSWQGRWSYRTLWDQYLPSTHANYAGGMADSILMFGGFNGDTGSLYDGASGGLLNDMWMLRLANYSTEGMRQQQLQNKNTHCAWRLSASAKKGTNTSTCLGSSYSNCDFRDMIMLAWCADLNQTMG